LFFSPNYSILPIDGALSSILEEVPAFEQAHGIAKSDYAG
jgi:hypothetical protein